MFFDRIYDCVGGSWSNHTCLRLLAPRGTLQVGHLAGEAGRDTDLRQNRLVELMLMEWRSARQKALHPDLVRSGSGWHHSTMDSSLTVLLWMIIKGSGW